jgi:hypothetical protein
MGIVQNRILIVVAAIGAAPMFAAPVSAKTICNGGGWCYNTSGKRIHYHQQPAVQNGWVYDRWHHRHWRRY